MDWDKAGVKIQITERPMNHKGSQVTVTLPTKEHIIEAETENFLVLIAQDNERIIMPQFLTYVISKIQKERKEKGKRKLRIQNSNRMPST